jgi:cyclic lactone autoinducer peptide
MKKFKSSKLILFSIITVLSVLAANISCQASWPWRVYQEELPKCLIKEDKTDC